MRNVRISICKFLIFFLALVALVKSLVAIFGSGRIYIFVYTKELLDADQMCHNSNANNRVSDVTLEHQFEGGSKSQNQTLDF